MTEPALPRAPTAPRPAWRRLLGFAPVVFGVALLVLLLRALGPQHVIAELARADPRFVVLAVLLNLTLNMLARTGRRLALLRPLPHAGPPASFGEVLSLTFASYAGNNLLPARAGDALYVVQLNRRHGYPLAGLVAAQLVEKLAEILTLWLLALATLWLVPAVGLRLPLLVGAVGLCLAAVVGLAFWAGRSRPGAWSRWPRLAALVERTAEAVGLLLAPHAWRPAVLWSLASDAVDAAMIGACLHAVDVHLGVGVWCLVLLAVNVAIALPASAANLGVLEAGAVFVLVQLGVPGDAALAFAVLYHAAHVLPVTLVGVFEFRHLRWSSRAHGSP